MCRNTEKQIETSIIEIVIDLLQAVEDIMEGSSISYIWTGPQMPKGYQYLSKESSKEFKNVK